MREETQLDICIYCGEEITQQQRPCKAMPNGKRAHLACYVDHTDDEEKEWAVSRRNATNTRTPRVDDELH